MDHDKPHQPPSHGDRRRYYDDSDDHVARVRAARERAEKEIRSFDPTFPYKIEYIHGQRTDIDYSKPPIKKEAPASAATPPAARDSRAGDTQTNGDTQISLEFGSSRHSEES